MRRMLRSMVTAVMLGAIVLTGAGCRKEPQPSTSTVRIAILQIVEHPAIDQLRDGFKRGLQGATEMNGKSVAFDYKNAQGDSSQINLIADQMVASQPALIYVMGTPCAQAVAKRTSTIPIVLGGATDPVSAGLIESWEKPGRNVTGTSDLPPFDAQLALFRKLMPNARRVGVVFNPGESNSVAAMERLRVAAGKSRITLVERSAVTSAEVAPAVRSLVGRVEALYVPPDNTVQSALDAVISVGRESGLPVFGGLLEMAKKGAVFSLSVDYDKLGEFSGQMAARVLAGAKPADMPVQLIDKPELSVNLDSVETYRLTIPPDVEQEIDQRIRGGRVVQE